MKPVRMYTTLTCPYCVRAKALLQQRGVTAIDEVRVDLEPEQRAHMMQLTGRRTVPQIFIGDTHVGGCDDLVDLDRRGGLLPLLGSAPPERVQRALGDNRAPSAPARCHAAAGPAVHFRKIPPWPTKPRPPCSRSSACT